MTIMRSKAGGQSELTLKKYCIPRFLTSDNLIQLNGDSYICFNKTKKISVF